MRRSIWNKIERPKATSQAPPLPWFGAAHPLRRGAETLLMNALALAAVIHLVAVLAGLIAARAREAPDDPVIITIPLTQMQPPPIRPEEVAPPSLPEIVSPAFAPEVGLPEPVQDFRALQSTIASQQEIGRLLQSANDFARSLTGIDSIVVRLPDATPQNSRPEDFDPREEMPALISLPAPIYPDMARQAEVEGLVLVEVLVGKDGRVREASVAEGIPMLDAAALDAARGAIFRPALQQHRPVEVRVRVPIRFTLR